MEALFALGPKYELSISAETSVRLQASVVEVRQNGDQWRAAEVFVAQFLSVEHLESVAVRGRRVTSRWQGCARCPRTRGRTLQLELLLRRTPRRRDRWCGRVEPKVLENLARHDGVLDERNDPAFAATFRAAEDVDRKNAHQQSLPWEAPGPDAGLGPRQRLAIVAGWDFRERRHHRGAPRRARREDAMVAH